MKTGVCHLEIRNQFLNHINVGGTFRLLLVLLLLIVFAISALSQGVSSSDCKVGKRAADTGFWTWAAGSQLQIYIMEKDFKSHEIPCLLKPLPRWNSVSETTGARVNIRYEGTTSQLLDCANCVTIMRPPVFNRRTLHASELKAFGLEGTRIIQYAAIYLDPGITGLETLTNAVAHELGHSFGLLDCYNCASGTTVMNRLSGMTSSNGMEGPTACDIAGVRTSYLELEARVRRAPKVIAIPEDEGEPPVDDDTPVVLPKP